jgi:hypothetical protein
MAEEPDVARPRLPRRDFVILPTLSLLTVAVMVSVAEVGARWYMPAVEGRESCVVTDPALGSISRPNCNWSSKVPEGPLVLYRHNECGFRSETSCRALAPDQLRLVVMGSSTSEGLYNLYEDTWSARAADKLSARCGKPIDVQNMSGEFTLQQTAYRTPDAVALKPTTAIFMVTPFDLLQIPPEDYSPDQKPNGTAPKAKLPAVRQLIADIQWLRILTLVQHFYYRQPESFIQLYLVYKDRADFLRLPFTPEWQHRMAYLDQVLGYMGGRFRDANIPFVVAFAPHMVQSYLAASAGRSGIDAFALGRAIAELARKNNVRYIDLTPVFANTKEAPEDLFMNQNQHWNSKGNAVVGATIFQSLTSSDGVEAFASCDAKPGG